jgi:hypothetical protein
MDNLPIHECVRVKAEKSVVRLVDEAWAEGKERENGDGEMVIVDY